MYVAVRPSALEVCSRQGAIEIHVYLTLPYLCVPSTGFTGTSFSMVIVCLIYTVDDRQT